MKGYINNIMSRSTQPKLNISPRLPGVFEHNYSTPASLHEEQDMPATTITEETPVKNEQPFKVKEQPTEINKTNKASLNNEKDDPVREQKPIVKQNSTAVFAEKPFAHFQPDEYPLNAAENLSEQWMPLKNEIKQPGFTEEKELVFPFANDKPVVNPFQQNIQYSLTEDDQFKKESPLLKEQVINTIYSDNQTVQYNNSLLVAEVNHSHSPVLPKENSTGAMVNYHEGTSVIKVSIGRIEVKAVATPSKPVKAAAGTALQSKMSLEDYLKKRNGNE
jgi:hypothetical protein